MKSWKRFIIPKILLIGIILSSLSLISVFASTRTVESKISVNNIYNMNYHPNLEEYFDFAARQNHVSTYGALTNGNASDGCYWSYYKNITIYANQVSSDLNFFPVLIFLYDEDLENNTQSNGNDIAFFDSSGNQLDHEIDIYEQNYNATHARLIAFVEANISASVDTIISMYYGNATMPNQEDIAGTWSNNYDAVYHLTEDPSTTIQDSTSNSRDLTSDGLMSSSQQTSVNQYLGTGYDFDGNNDRLDEDNFEYDRPTALTWTAWIETDTVGWQTIINPIESDNDFTEWTLSNTGNIEVYWPSGSCTFSTTYSPNTLIFIAYAWDGTTSYSYKNGIQDDTDGSDPLNFQDAEIRIGAYLPAMEVFDGGIDEVTLSSVFRGQDWINATYRNQIDPFSFYSVGEEQSAGETDDGLGQNTDPDGLPWYLQFWWIWLLLFLSLGIGMVIWKRNSSERLDPTIKDCRIRALLTDYTSPKGACKFYDRSLRSKCQLDPLSYRKDCQGLDFVEGYVCRQIRYHIDEELEEE